IIDFFTWLLSGFKIGDAVMPVKIVVLIIGCGILAFGMSIVIKSEAGTGPNDLVAVVISDKSKIRFAAVRIVTDVIFVLTGFLLGGKFGIGTIICAFLVGPVADVCMPFSKSLADRCVHRIRKNNL
ncbi:YitT family protein, partial [Ruminococcus sp.]|uniref:YczE/YyaS/YitT family protein n=1 Tax=Ruminococcus sp. TaxID=41978 RepID=UPI0025ED7C9B